MKVRIVFKDGKIQLLLTFKDDTSVIDLIKAIEEKKVFVFAENGVNKYIINYGEVQFIEMIEK